MKYRELLFKRGYLFTNKNIERVDNYYINFLKNKFSKLQINEFYLYYCSDNKMSKYSDKELFICILGIVMDPKNKIKDSQKIVKKLHILYKKSIESFFDYLDILNGRFILFLISRSKSFILQDACGMKTLFYDIKSNNIIVSSHVQIIAEMQRYVMDNAVKIFIQGREYRNALKYLPGLKTAYTNILMLTPNTLLDLKDRKIKRFFPRSFIKMRKIDDYFLKELSHILITQVDLLGKIKKLLFH